MNQRNGKCKKVEDRSQGLSVVFLFTELKQRFFLQTKLKLLLFGAAENKQARSFKELRHKVGVQRDYISEMWLAGIQKGSRAQAELKEQK